MLRHQDNSCCLGGSPVAVIERGSQKMIEFRITEVIGIGVYNPASLTRLPPEGVVVPVDEECLGHGEMPEGLHLCQEGLFAV